MPSLAYRLRLHPPCYTAHRRAVFADQPTTAPSTRDASPAQKLLLGAYSSAKDTHRKQAVKPPSDGCRIKVVKSTRYINQVVNLVIVEVVS